MLKIKFYITLIFLFIASTLLLSQSVKSTSVLLQKDKKATGVFTLIEAEKDVVEDYYVDFMEDRFDIDLDREDREKNYTLWLADKVTLPAISEGPMDFYTKIVDTQNGSTEVVAVFATGYDSYINPIENSAAFNRAEALMTDFVNSFYQYYYSEQYEAALDDFNDLQKDQEKLEEKIADLRKDNQKMEEEIVKLKGKIQENKQEIIERQSELQSKTEAVKQANQKKFKVEQKLKNWQ